MIKYLCIFGALVLSLGTAFFACDGAVESDADADADTDSDTDADADEGPRWAIEVIAGDNVGQYSSIDVDSNGKVGVAYWGFNRRQGEDCPVKGQPTPTYFVPLYFSYREPGADTWQQEQVSEEIYLGAPKGCSFRFAPDDTPSIALQNGEPIDVLCEANDAALATRAANGTWTATTVAANPSDAAPNDQDTCNAGASTAGYGVGDWPGLCFDSTGTYAVMYRDTHFQGMQRDDLHRADTQVAIGGANYMVDCGSGGGTDNACIFDSEDSFIGFHRITTDSALNQRHGLWANRLEPDGTWSRWMVTPGLVGFQESSVVALGDGQLALVYYDPGSGHPWVAELVAPDVFMDGASWTQERIGDDRYVEGDYPSIAVSPEGRLAVAYYRCARSAEGASCTSPTDSQDGVVFAWRGASGSWTREVVEEGGLGQCGRYISLAFGPDGAAYISYVCARNVAGDEFVEELKVATRRPL
jgi:hypothetical protein